MSNFRRILLASALVATPLSASFAQSHVYQLDGSLADQFGGPSLVSEGGTLDPLGYTFGPNQGLTLSNVFSAGSSYSLVIRSMFTEESSRTWRKIVDYKDLTSDLGYYDKSGISWMVGAGTGGTPFVNNVMSFIVLTRDAGTGLASVYVNGVQSLTFYDGSGIADFTGTNGIARFFQDDTPTSGGEAAPGYVDYIATYDRALTSDEVATLAAVPVTSTPEPASLALLVTGLVGVTAAGRRRRA